MDSLAQVLQETTKKLTPGISSRRHNGVIAQSIPAIRKAAAAQMNRTTGKRARYTERVGKLICQRISNGETLVDICRDLELAFVSVMEWLDQEEKFGEAYRRARKSMAVNLVDELINKTGDLKSEDALAARVRSDVVKWVASKFNPEEFSDLKRIELKGEVNHKHTHELALEQKRRIAESWLISQEQETALPAITAETTGPDLPSLECVAVREICEGEQGERPKRKRSAPAKTGKQKRKPGRPRKLTVDDPIDCDNKPKAK
jgi:hypothetical protein